ncbi:uncharacterized protein LOC106459422 [Limulus polyphemus]|uniref:Uncharacterized protein LOC106459422 n=1 Tax=Limulus polyphemus TaxID=6850 RepID=A0ABM1SDD0_LIMPO|nr:uncharacterized protein LOC106459422 [Limulus polyphemus]XP_022241633.1 uncharacterized protein LOC106459422 [Limulus polyphemus]XP_022241634.1 uncharacterized protein LOC106459422 [Limulus polyphemus]XP_022241635.1 uncharacterized protein LOC106459422 [Limulus polyphemus]
MGQIMLYLLPLILGRTFNERTSKPGIDIYKQSRIDANKKVVERHFTEALYKLSDRSQKANNFLGVSGELALNIKGGNIKVKGTGDYLREASKMTNTVEILVKVHYETITETIQLSRDMLQPDIWREDIPKDILGTHFVRSITYGGELIASIRYKANRIENLEDIKAKLEANIGTGGGFNVAVKGQLDKTSKELSDISSMEIQYYATVPIADVPHTIEGLTKLVEKFPEQAKQVNNGSGVPIRMELVPLSALKSMDKQFSKTMIFNAKLNEMGAQFDDIKYTKRALFEWMTYIPLSYLPEEYQRKIGLLNTRLDTVNREIFKVLDKLDLSTSGEVSQFKDAFDNYQDGGISLPGKYFHQFLKLRDEIISNVTELQELRGGSTYIWWGSDNCGTSSESQKTAYEIYRGVAVISDVDRGSSASILCFPNDLQLDSDEDLLDESAKLVQIKYRFDSEENFLACSICRLRNVTAPTMFPGQNKCPESWTLHYGGFLMATETAGRKGKFICVDRNVAIKTGKLSPILMEVNPADNQPLITYTTLFTQGTPLYKKDTLLPCVVCSY